MDRDDGLERVHRTRSCRHSGAQRPGARSPGNRSLGARSPQPGANKVVSRLSLSRLGSDYGMLVVLLLLCVYYSLATLTEQSLTGAAAAEAIAASIDDRDQNIFIAARGNPEDVRFVRALEDRLRSEGAVVLGSATGEPHAVRRALEEAAAEQSVDVIATTPEFATVMRNVGARVSGASGAQIVTARTYRWPAFLRADNLRNVANQIVVIAIIAVGMTMVIITAGIDLSVGSLIALSAVVAAWLIRAMGGVAASVPEMILASLLAILICGLVGLFSGLVITQFSVPPFIATLGMMLVASGLAYIIARGESIYDIPDSYVWLGRGADFLSIPNAVVLMVLIYVAAHILMTRTKLGRYIYAVGGNPEAARLSGIRVSLVLLFVYMVSGLMAGLGGIVQASQLKSGAPTYGLLYELYVIAAVVVGGTSLSGGHGRITGTLVGAFIIGVIQNGMNLTGVESYTQKVVLGFVILGAVLIDMLKKREWWGKAPGAGRRAPRSGKALGSGLRAPGSGTA